MCDWTKDIMSKSWYNNIYIYSYCIHANANIHIDTLIHWHKNSQNHVKETFISVHCVRVNFFGHKQNSKSLLAESIHSYVNCVFFIGLYVKF